MTDGAQIGTQTTTEKTPKSSPKRTPKSSLKSSLKSSPKTRDVIVELMRTNPIVTIAEIATIVHTSERNVKKHTKNLQDEGFIRRIDGKNGGHWEVIE